MPHSARRLNAIARHCGASRYLEIGVARGRTFFSVNMPFKGAVDPAFQFDPEQHQADGQFFFSGTSDDFFRQFSSLPEASTFMSPGEATAFDVIFIDGLHSYQQVMQDFANSLSFAHEKTVWLLDDTVPDDPYSALTEQTKCMAYKQQAGVHSQSWQGDVFKSVFALHDRYPDYSYCTLVGKGNPQTVVWKMSQPEPRAPLFASPDALDSLDYFAIMDFCHVFMPVEEEGFVERIGSNQKPEDFQSPDLWKLFFHNPIRTKAEIELLALARRRHLL